MLGVPSHGKTRRDAKRGILVFPHAGRGNEDKERCFIGSQARDGERFQTGHGQRFRFAARLCSFLRLAVRLHG